MDTLDNLKFRACKAYGYNRLCSIRKRFYMVSGEEDGHILSMLQSLCEKYALLKDREIRDMVERLNPDHWMYNKKYSYTRNAIEFYISIIRFTKVDGIDGYVSPAKFR